jgi:hypothetical protein
MKYAGEMGTGAIIYIPSFIETGSAIQRLVGVQHRQRGDIISLLSFIFQNTYKRRLRDRQ